MQKTPWAFRLARVSASLRSAAHHTDSDLAHEAVPGPVAAIPADELPRLDEGVHGSFWVFLYSHIEDDLALGRLVEAENTWFERRML